MRKKNSLNHFQEASYLLVYSRTVNRGFLQNKGTEKKKKKRRKQIAYVPSK